VVNTNTFYRSRDNFQCYCNILVTFLIALSRLDCQVVARTKGMSEKQISKASKRLDKQMVNHQQARVREGGAGARPAACAGAAGLRGTGENNVVTMLGK
jgi:hypothetical protein